MSAGRENVYTCTSCSARLVTVDRHDGVTPMFIRCGDQNPHGCGRDMISAGYPPPPRPAHIPAPTHEWYRPTSAELRRYLATIPVRARLATREHVRKGGLLIRPLLAGVVQ